MTRSLFLSRLASTVELHKDIGLVSRLQSLECSRRYSFCDARLNKTIGKTPIWRPKRSLVMFEPRGRILL